MTCPLDVCSNLGFHCIPFYTNARPADRCPYLVQLLELSKEENSITVYCNLHEEMLFAFAGVSFREFVPKNY